MGGAGLHPCPVSCTSMPPHTPRGLRSGSVGGGPRAARWGRGRQPHLGTSRSGGARQARWKARGQPSQQRSSPPSRHTAHSSSFFCGRERPVSGGWGRDAPTRSPRMAPPQGTPGPQVPWPAPLPADACAQDPQGPHAPQVHPALQPVPSLHAHLHAAPSRQATGGRPVGLGTRRPLRPRPPSCLRPRLYGAHHALRDPTASGSPRTARLGTLHSISTLLPPAAGAVGVGVCD